MLNIFMHQKQNLMEKKRKEKVEYLLHERALLMKENFRIQRTLFNSVKPKILYLQKRSSKGKSLQNIFNVRGIEKSEKKSQKEGGQKV